MFDNMTPKNWHFMQVIADKLNIAYQNNSDAQIPFEDLKDLFGSLDDMKNQTEDQNDDFPDFIGDSETLAEGNMNTFQTLQPSQTVHVKNSIKFITAKNFDELERKLEETKNFGAPIGNVQSINGELVMSIFVYEETITEYEQ